MSMTATVIVLAILRHIPAVHLLDPNCLVMLWAQAQMTQFWAFLFGTSVSTTLVILCLIIIFMQILFSMSKTMWVIPKTSASVLWDNMLIVQFTVEKLVGKQPQSKARFINSLVLFMQSILLCCWTWLPCQLPPFPQSRSMLTVRTKIPAPIPMLLQPIPQP